MEKTLTLDDIRQMNDVCLVPDTVGRVIGCDPHNIRCAAKVNPEMLGFPIIRVGTRTLIPRLPFIKFMEGEIAAAYTPRIEEVDVEYVFGKDDRS